MHPSMFLLGICIFSAPPSCSAKTQQQSRNVRRPKFGVQKTCAVTKMPNPPGMSSFLRIWLLWPSLPTISTVTYMGKQNLQRKPSSGQDQLLNCAVTTRECPHSRLSRLTKGISSEETPELTSQCCPKPLRCLTYPFVALTKCTRMTTNYM